MQRHSFCGLLRLPQWVAITTIVCIGAFVLAAPVVRCVSISNRNLPQECVLSRAALAGFVISYTHSVNKGRIHDFYACEGDELVLYKTQFVSYGAGMPEARESDGFAVTTDGYVVNNVNRRLQQLVMAVGVTSEHSISINSSNGFNALSPADEISFQTMFAPQTSLIFEITRVSLCSYLCARRIR